ncbi:unnamed protein product [Bathycoccus prasinos]
MTTKKKSTPTYAVEKHDRNEKITLPLPPPLPPPVHTSSSVAKTKKKEICDSSAKDDGEEEEAKERLAEEGLPAAAAGEELDLKAKNEDETAFACEAKEDDERERHVLCVEEMGEDAVGKALESISREFCEKKVSEAVDYDLVNAKIEIMISQTLEILNEGKRAKASPLTVSIFGSLDENRFGCENSRWPGFEETESEAKFQELVRERIDAFVERCQVDIEKENQKRRGSGTKKTMKKMNKNEHHCQHQHQSRALKPWLGA